MNATATAHSAAHSVVEASRLSKWISGSLVAAYALLAITPLVWIAMTSFKTPADAIAYPPKAISAPSFEGWCNLFTIRSRQTPEYMASLPPATGYCDGIARERGMVIAGPSKTPGRLMNSLVIGFGSTFLAVFNSYPYFSSTPMPSFVIVSSVVSGLISLTEPTMVVLPTPKPPTITIFTAAWAVCGR